ncbi:hypothetical protein ACWEKT_40240 [Nocardia takedensis]|uniref:hypothetical protein n=1 Tax=Nocardia takedensis TaxID=259390 RepID=UPI003F75A3A8
MTSAHASAAQRLLSTVVHRYGSLEEFLARVRADPLAQTMVLPVLDENGRPLRPSRLVRDAESSAAR